MKIVRNGFRIGRFWVKLQRWPWQENKGKRWAPLNPRADRFGGGWAYKLGVDVGGGFRTYVLNLIWGMVRIEFADTKRHLELLEREAKHREPSKSGEKAPF